MYNIIKNMIYVKHSEVASKMGENLLCYKLHLDSQQTSHIVSNHFAL